MRLVRGGEAVGLAAFEGAILGLAIGDALGFPVERLRRAEIERVHGAAGVTDFVASARYPAGTYSDDTQMTIAVAEALLEAGGDDLDALMRATAERFVAWSRSAESARGPGKASLAGCARLALGVDWREAGAADSKGCGSAMRVAPIGLLFFREQERLLEVARASSLLTQDRKSTRLNSSHLAVSRMPSSA